MFLIKTKTDKMRALDILEKAFYDIPGVMWMIRSQKNRKRHLRVFLSYCFKQTAQKEGAYLTGDRNGVVFFYRLQKDRKRFLNIFRTLYLVLKVTGFKRTVRILKTRKIVDSIRPKSGWYGWFLATERNVAGVSAGYEIKHEMYRMADATNEPIYVETTVKRIMDLYFRIGFREYARIKHPYENIDIWFMKRDPHTFNT